jgi:hypothetical protein
MPRPERPLDPSAGPVQEFAAALRELRAEAGNPTYREMARTVPASKASLSAAAAGHRLPTWEVTREYARACGGDLEEWRGRWEEVAEKPGRPAPSDATPPRPRRRPAILVGATAMAAIAAVVVFLVAARGEPEGRTAVANSAPALRAVPSAAAFDTAQPVADNADPKKSGCASGANADRIVSLDEVEVNTDGQAVFGAILLDGEGCVEATVLVESAAGGGSATTRCRSGPPAD